MMPVFLRMDFIVHYDASRGGIGWSELEAQREIRLDELLRAESSFDILVWARLAKPGEYRWFGVKTYLSRVC